MELANGASAADAEDFAAGGYVDARAQLDSDVLNGPFHPVFGTPEDLETELDRAVAVGTLSPDDATTIAHEWLSAYHEGNMAAAEEVAARHFWQGPTSPSSELQDAS